MEPLDTVTERHHTRTLHSSTEAVDGGSEFQMPVLPSSHEITLNFHLCGITFFSKDVFSVDSWNNSKDHFIEIKDSQLALKPKEKKKIPIKPQRDNEGGCVDGSNRTG